MFGLVLEVLFFLVCFGLMSIILLQMSEHSGLGGAFGSGMSSTVFGRDVTKDPKRTLTIGLAAAYMILGLILTIL
jgi:preprotein translocase subunit SecG